MSAALFSAFYDISEFLCNENEKSLNNNYNNFNSMLDKKAVGSPVGFAPGFPRRHSTSNLQALTNSSSTTAKYPGNFANIKESSVIGIGGGGGTTALLNKENKFRDRSFSENQQLSSLQLIQQQQQQQQKQPSGGGGQVNSTRYKTELCRPFEESGTCKYGDKCQFAHGMHELRSLTRHPKYKTELCRTFHTIGFCPYGPRCHFIHNAEERRQAPCGGGGGGGGNNNNNHPAAAAAGLSAFHHQHHQHSRPKLHHSQSFAGFPSAPSGLESPLMESPTSRTPPPLCSSSSCCSSAALSSCSSSSSSSSSSASSSTSSSSMYCDELMLSPGVAGVVGSGLGGSGSGSGGGSSSLGQQLQHPPPPPPPPTCANNAFTFSSQELSNLLTPLAVQTQQLSGYPHPPPSPTYTLSHMHSCLRRMAESPVFDASPSPPDSLSDRESYLSSSGSLSGSESPSMDPARRLPIFSRLSISED
ncbi:mRNA decay activator protein ZFP36L2 [Callorhinchus milii]|uniref:mRNA decay activator protein ZFP36L2 n=1 Tax=Callorhinchus milii TaxID=7868 RepID=UPI001C3F7E01|nr:mRNA decay activator protein ZFP36L2 [Callorhinchus milii]